MASLFRSLQARLIFSFVLVTAVALAVAAGVFVAARKEDQERQELDRVAALSPGVVRELFLKAGMDPERFSLERFADEMSALHHVRILVFGPDQVVTADSGKGLVGEVVALPSQGEVRLGEGGEPYFAFQTPNGTATDNLVLVEASLPEFGAGQSGGPPSMQGVRADRVVLAVPESTITRAWLDLLPALGVAAGVAFPVAILLAILLARSIAQPVHQLTVASRQVSEGSFDVTVQTGRQDEIGQLSDAFAAMAHRVGATQSQMRQLVANVSHDLKTPLTSILGFSRALSSGAATDPDEARHMGAVIEEEAKRLSTRLNDLMFLSELDAGRALPEWAEVDLSLLASSVASRLTPAGDPRWHPATLEPGLVVRADGPKLERVIENLVSNALKFTPPDGRIDLRTFLEAGRPIACLELSNTANGLEPGEVNRLFDRLYRRDRSRSGPDGSGLGLAIARDLARLMHGALDARLDGDVLTMRLRLSAATGAVQ